MILLLRRSSEIMQHEQLVEQGRAIVQNAPQSYIDLDVEADGKPGYGSLLSIGAVSPWGEEFYVELKPTSNVFVRSQRDFCEEHGLERERLQKEGVEPRKALRDLARWTIQVANNHDKQGSVLTAFNASFDYPWIDIAMLQAGMPKNPYGVAGYCIKSLALALSDTYDWKQTTKGNLPTELVPEGDFTHNALEDARYQQKIHFALAAKLALIHS
jgi:hypothetical protein